MKMNTNPSLLDLLNYYSVPKKKKPELSEKYDNLICPICNKQLYVLKKHEKYYTTETPVVCTYCTSFHYIHEENNEYSLRLLTIEEIVELTDDVRNDLIYLRKQYKQDVDSE